MSRNLIVPQPPIQSRLKIGILATLTLLEDTLEERCWVEIDVDAISYNIRSVERFTGKRVLAVIKANGCGHGLVPVARAVLAGGAAILGVGTAAEALEIVGAGIVARILVLGFVPFSSFDTLCRHGIEVAVWNLQQKEALAEAADRVHRKAILHVWADVEMGRFGSPIESVQALVRSCLASPSLVLTGLMGHLPSVEERPYETERHIDQFASLVRLLEAEGIRPPEVHLSNSDALSFFDSSWFDMVRAGVIMYGAPGSDRSMPLRPALAWKARILDVQVRPKGFTIGYGSEYTLQDRDTIAVIGVGYADGYRRLPKNVNSVILKGQQVRVVGRLCTQNCIIVVPTEQIARVGEVVTVLGCEAGVSISAEDLASRWQTNTWDVFCGISSQIPRIYINN